MELKIDLSIGTLEGDSTLMFGFIQHIAVDAEGGIYAFDGQVPALRYFNARGEYVRLVEESPAAEAQGRLHHERQVGKCTDGTTICATYGSMRRPFRPFD